MIDWKTTGMKRTSAHPAKTEKAQPDEVAPIPTHMVPKPGFEPGQAYAH